MNLYFDAQLAIGYKSNAQIARVLTEAWLSKNGYCPNCGCKPIIQFSNNLPVRDFYCSDCDEQFELKSKQAKSAGKSITDGAYSTMIERIQAEDNPNFFFLSYRKIDYSVQQLMLVPKHFLTADMIIRRKPLPETARRAGWVGCTMNIGMLPESGKILLVDNAQIIQPETVCQQWQQSLFLRQQKAERKGWLLAIMRCIEKLPEQFTLTQVYAFESQLKLQFPKNQHIKEKIRQQLQMLREQKMIEFIGRGQYQKIHNI
ncbi:MAG: DpnI domain-containing protein [Neisseria sp.]